MKKLRESVSAIFRVSQSEKIFGVKRQNYLSVFPGYTSFPGGKVDRTDREDADKLNETPFGIPETHWVALKREIQEELNFDIEENLDLVQKISLFGTAITPEFNPYRFKAHFYLIDLVSEIDFNVDKGEASFGKWQDPKAWFEGYKSNELMMVPPIIRMLEELINAPPGVYEGDGDLDIGLPHIEGREVPMIESLAGVKQFLPLSNTFPPANRTNCFIIGDAPNRFLIDPSPKNEEEYEKLKRSLDKVGFDKIFISHHHPDHHEFIQRLYHDYKKPIFLSEKTVELISQKWGKEYLKGLPLYYLKEGDVIGQTLGRDLVVYEVPGHDEGQLALAPKDLSWFFVGDLIQTVGTVVIGGPEGDMKKYFESLEKVMALNPKYIIPSHGIAIGGIHKLKMTLKHRKHREEQIIELLKEGKNEDEILAVIYEDLDERLVKYARKTIKAHIKKINS